MFDRASSSRRPLTDGELEQLYGYHPVQRTDDWYDLYQDETVVTRRRRLFVPLVALFVAAGAAFTTYALVRNDAEGMGSARSSVLQLLRLEAPAMASEPLPERDRVADVNMVEPLVGVVFSNAMAERSVERTEDSAEDTQLTPSSDPRAAARAPRRAPPRRAAPARPAEPAPIAEPRSEGERLIMAPTTQTAPGAEPPAGEDTSSVPAQGEASSPVIEAPAEPSAPEAPTTPRTPDFGI